MIFPVPGAVACCLVATGASARDVEDAAIDGTLAFENLDSGAFGVLDWNR